MKVTITQNVLIFHDTKNEELKELLSKLDIDVKIIKNKIHVYADTKTLYYILYEMSQENDIDLI